MMVVFPENAACLLTFPTLNETVDPTLLHVESYELCDETPPAPTKYVPILPKLCAPLEFMLLPPLAPSLPPLPPPLPPLPPRPSPADPIQVHRERARRAVREYRAKMREAYDLSELRRQFSVELSQVPASYPLPGTLGSLTRAELAREFAGSNVSAADRARLFAQHRRARNKHYARNFRRRHRTLMKLVGAQQKK